MSVINAPILNSATVQLALTAASANVALPQKGGLVNITNYGTGTAMCASGDSTVVASATTSMMIPAGQTFGVRINPKDTHIAGISGTTTSISISVVNGVTRA